MPRRSAYTLLEVLLSMAIAMLLLGALYTAVGYQLRQAQTGRDLIGQATLARAVLGRMGREISAAANLCDPARFRNLTNALLSASNNSSGQSTTSGGSAGGSTAGGSNSAGGTTSGASASAGSSTSGSSAGSSTTTTQTSTNAVTLPLGVIGDSTTLNLFVSRVPSEVWTGDPTAAVPTTSDLRRIYYWLAPDNGGLCRQEIKVVTSQDALSTTTPTGDLAQYVLAPEIRSVEFSYFDGTNWQESWDSTTPGPDGVTPQGSPRAVAVKIGVVPPGGKTEHGKDPELKYYRHVVALAGANGTTPLQQPNPDNPAIAAQQNAQSGQSGATSSSSTNGN